MRYIPFVLLLHSFWHHYKLKKKKKTTRDTEKKIKTINGIMDRSLSASVTRLINGKRQAFGLFYRDGVFLFLFFYIVIEPTPMLIVNKFVLRRDKLKIYNICKCFRRNLFFFYSFLCVNFVTIFFFVILPFILYFVLWN